MGNRAVIVNNERPEVGLYLHWNGGPESVLAFLEAAKQLGVRSPSSDPEYWLARQAQIIGNFFGGNISVGIGPTKNLDCDNGDNGVYHITDFAIVERRHDRSRGAKTVGELTKDETARYESILANCLKANAMFTETA